jgi:regulator of protease activity HflC (stomatin/prohibitin superfamily)
MNRLTTAMAAIALAFAGTACTIIEDGQVGVLKTFGSIADEPVGRGPTLVFPVVRQIEKWNIKRQDLKETADMPSSEGLIVRLDTSLQFRVQPDKAPYIRKNTGRNYREVLLVPYFRNEIRDVVSAYPVRSIYSEEGRNQIAARIQANLEELAVLLRDVQLPARFKESIEAKLTAEQRVQQKDFELAQARKDAEIEVARAKGAAKAQEIVRSTLSSSYLHYLWIKTLNENPNVIYVATEANMPIFKNVK